MRLRSTPTDYPPSSTGDVITITKMQSSAFGKIASAKSETVIFALCLGQLPHHSINGPSMKTGWTNQIQGGGRPVAPSLHTRGMHQLLQKCTIVAILNNRASALQDVLLG